VFERRARWERALACTRAELALGFCLAAALLAIGLSLRPHASSLAVAVAGFLVGLLAHTGNRLVLGQSPLWLKIDWESDPEAVRLPRGVVAGVLVAALTAVAVAIVYLAAGRTWKSLVALFGGMFLAYALIAALQRVLLDRDFAHRFAGR
jgi:hypothetical protein